MKALGAIKNLLLKERADGAKTLEAEMKCRADAKCLIARQVRKMESEICTDLAIIDDAKAAIAAERSNPGGVVNLEVLHSSGETIQAYQAAVREALPKYTTLAHHAFVRATACK